MNTGTILKVGGGFLVVVGALLGATMLRSGFDLPGILGVLVLGVLPIGIGLALLKAGRRTAQLEGEQTERGFSDAVANLAKARGGQVGLEAVCRSTGLTSAEATARMRALTGRGMFELDFDDRGQMVFRLSADAGRAQLAALARAPERE